MLAPGYAATVALLVVDGRRLINVLAPVGRMAWTNYLMQSIICVTLSYGFGLGLWWRIGAAKAMAIAAAVIVVQIPLSALWLSRFRFGPVEWVWRRLTYGRRIWACSFEESRNVGRRVVAGRVLSAKRIFCRYSGEKDRLLRTYWSIPPRQIETTVVLADARWTAAESSAAQ